MKLDFTSRMDGSTDTIATERPPLDAVFVLDTSGSMSSSFPQDTDRRSKLEVAKECILKIFRKLTKRDRIAIVLFCDRTQILLPLEKFRASSLMKVRQLLQPIRPSGGTNLSRGLSAGFDALDMGTPVEPRMQRVFFLTDMESNVNDEIQMLQMAKTKATRIIESDLPPVPPMTRQRRAMQESGKETSTTPATATSPSHLTIVGIGVDLSIDTVGRLSAIPGAKYMSVISAAELEFTVVDDFDYDVTPIAFNISIALSAGLAFQAAHGSAELNNLPAGLTSAFISAEFPVPYDTDSTNATVARGGVYVFKLQEDSAALANSGDQRIRFQWQNREGRQYSHEEIIALPDFLTDDEEVAHFFVDRDLRKAVALIRYVETLTAYVVNDDHENPAVNFQIRRPFGQSSEHASCENDDGEAITATTPLLQEETAAWGQDWTVDKLLAVTDPLMLPQGWTKDLMHHIGYARIFRALETHLLSEMRVCGDDSLTTNNQNVLQTVQQVKDIEVSAVSSFLRDQQTRRVLSIRASALAAVEHPRGMVCPITLTLMQDPVIATDGHSYQRVAIENRLAQGTRVSPVTGTAMQNNDLIPNHSLKQAIQDYLAFTLA